MKITSEMIKKVANGRLTDKQIDAVLKVQDGGSLQDTADAIKKALGEREPAVHKIVVGEFDGKKINKSQQFAFQTNKDVSKLTVETVFGLMFQAEKVNLPPELVELTDTQAAKKTRQATGPEGALTWATKVNNGQ